jgi:hypothetical protein
MNIPKPRSTNCCCKSYNDVLAACLSWAFPFGEISPRQIRSVAPARSLKFFIIILKLSRLIETRNAQFPELNGLCYDQNLKFFIPKFAAWKFGFAGQFIQIEAEVQQKHIRFVDIICGCIEICSHCGYSLTI